MSESFPAPESPHPKSTPPVYTPIIIGVVLVLAGGYLLLTNLGLVPAGLVLHNWWALFLLIPAFSSLYNAWLDFKANGTFTPAGRRPLFGGIVLLVITGVFLFDVDWGILWPVLLILAGLAALTGRFLKI